MTGSQQVALRLRGRISTTSVYLVLTVAAAFSVAPLLLVAIGSFRATSEIHQSPAGLPTGLSLDNYVTAWQDASMSTYFVNSAIVTVSAVLLCLTVSTMAAYAFSRFSFPLQTALIALTVAGVVIPARVGLLPLFNIFKSMGLIDSLPALAVLYAAEAVPFSILLLMTFFHVVPDELFEAARLDGANEGRVFWSVVLPQMRPSLAVVAIFQFAPIWNDFFYPLVFLRDTEKYTLPVGLTSFFGQFSTDLGVLFAGLMLALTPVVILFVFLTKQIVSGLTAGMGK